MKYLKILSVALAIGAIATACEVDADENCYRCTASDPNGVGATVSDETCGDDLTADDKATFRASFEALHDPNSYTITCADL